MDVQKIRTFLIEHRRILIISAGVLVCGIVLGAGGVYGISHIMDGGEPEDAGSDSGDEFSFDGADGVGSSEELDSRCPGGTWVDIAGAIESPGVYCAGADWVLDTLISEAGGYMDDACFGLVERQFNLAQLVEPNSKIYVPFETDAECLVASTEEDTGSGTAAVSDNGTAVAGASGGGSAGCVDGKVNINTATQTELETLPGIGPVTAGKILEGRPYSNPEDLLDVSGIGPSTLEKIQDEICL